MARLVEVSRRLPNGNHDGSELGRGPARSVLLRLPGVPGELPCQLRSDARCETGRIQFDAARLAGAASLTAGQAGSTPHGIIRLVRSQAGERVQRSPFSLQQDAGTAVRVDNVSISPSCGYLTFAARADPLYLSPNTRPLISPASHFRCSMPNLLKTISILLILASTPACVVTPDWTNPGNIRTQQLRAMRHDPYAKTDVAPPVVGGRPREYLVPAPQAVRDQPQLSNFLNRPVPRLY